MKNTISRLLTVSCLALSIATSTQAQSLKIPAASPSQTVKQSFGLGDITIEYSRPLVRNRVIFGELVPYGKVWRTGANSATKLTFSEDVTFGGQPVKAGTYALYTIPGKSSWKVMLYSDLTLAGNVADYNKEKEVLRIEVAPKMTDHKVESFTINLDKVKATTATLELSWDDVRVPVKIATEIDGKVMKSIDAALAMDTRPYYQAATYYYDNNKDLDKASEWIGKAVEQNPKAFWVRMQQAKIQLKKGERKAALNTAEEVIRLATEAKNDDYVKMAKKFIAENK
ncbi:DUF2911 domain-containing protein [Rurimicrobium arvi]|uniref:DUF2911 domain-containing protein n=1 Tax=Rurimicrobium arvi TaxID=2049916 RepID=A0ABP8MKL2_9BACT